MLEDKLNIIELIDTYGMMLTKTKKEILRDYYMLDISLGEIAEVRKISRQAVFDSITKSVEKLKSYEDNFKIISKQKELKQLLMQYYDNKKLNKRDIKKFLGGIGKIMAAFSNLSEKINHIFSKITKKGRLTELEIKEAMRDIRIALLEADVNFMVVKNFINKVTQKAIGEEVLKSLTPGQQVIKIVKDELIEVMGGTNSKLNISSKLPSVTMVCGLQGAGKTTFCAKLGLMLRKQGKKPLLCACDIYRPAAIKQLQVISKGANLEVFEKGLQNPVKTAQEALEYARMNGYDNLIIDTAGRLHINEELMVELQNIKSKVEPSEILLVVDAMTGQDAVNVATTFNEKLDVTGVVLTKLDGDTRGGAALSIKAVTGKPIKFSSIGEKITDLEPFYPDRMASRILGMGDVLTLIEKAENAINEEEVKKMEKAFKENSFTLEDYLTQLESLKKMGGLKDVLSMLPGVSGKINMGSIDESVLYKNKAIIQSMTSEERLNPDIIKANRKKRIADGSGTTIQDVNTLLKQFDQMKQMMKQMKGKKFGKMPFMKF